MNTQTNLETKETKTDTAIDKAQDAAVQVKDKAGETAAAAKEQAKRAVSQVSDQAKTTVDSRMSDVALELGNVADVVRQTTQGVGAGDTVVHYGERIAEQIEGVSSYLDEHGVEEILTDIQDFARRQPAVFLGGAFMLGIVIGRFLRSSAGRGMDYGRGDFDGNSGNYSSGGSRYADYTGMTNYTGETGSGRSSTPTGATGSPGYNRSTGTTRPSGSVGSTGQDDYAGRNRYQTGITQESTTTQDES